MTVFFFFSGSLLAATGPSPHLRTDIHLVILIIPLSDTLPLQLSVGVHQSSGRSREPNYCQSKMRHHLPGTCTDPMCPHITDSLTSHGYRDRTDEGGMVVEARVIELFCILLWVLECEHRVRWPGVHGTELTGRASCCSRENAHTQLLGRNLSPSGPSEDK